MLPSSRVMCVEFHLSAQMVGMLDLLTKVSPSSAVGGAHLRSPAFCSQGVQPPILAFYLLALAAIFGVFVLLSGNANALLYTEVDKQ